MESAWYDGAKINGSRNRVDRLGFFETVEVETPAYWITDQVDVNVKVKEKPTGNLMLGAGFSSSEKNLFFPVRSTRKICSVVAKAWDCKSVPAKSIRSIQIVHRPIRLTA